MNEQKDTNGETDMNEQKDTNGETDKNDNDVSGQRNTNE